ncbi:hypothetical protein DB30_01743 [Enhygromyxa salina]|uniref:Transposase IS801/IS1294 domain-containing protein n=1 Tax=Enhygromyxa salina TaxID=215803 RepID=A0A0C2CWP0_9BACT|nr:transposase [Enhygromyxa salina]KIG12267.1 hypothetical protein DB30_01743 [Enhygromyxa salina]
MLERHGRSLDELACEDAPDLLAQEQPALASCYGASVADRQLLGDALAPLDLIARLCALIPPRRFHMLRYHGVLAAHANRSGRRQARWPESA